MSDRTMRRLRRTATAVAAMVLGAAATAQADVTGTVASPTGLPLGGVSVSLVDSRGATVTSTVTTTAAGTYALRTPSRSSVPPYTVRARALDRCAVRSLEGVAGPVADGAVAPVLVLDPTLMCAAPYLGSSLRAPTAYVATDRPLVLAPPGGVAYVRAWAPSGAADVSLSLADGTVVGTSGDADTIPLTAPNRAYDGPLNLSFTHAGEVTSRPIGVLRIGTAPRLAQQGGPSDLAAIVDVSGSMSSADGSFRRKDAVKLLIDLADNGDRLAGVGFDNRFHDIFGRTTITGAASKTQLKRLTDRRIVNLGGTDYDVAFEEAYRALTAEPLRPGTPKAAIFLTDGAHNGTYRNSHLAFALNGTGRSWPVCVVQLGRGFSASDTARLKRIAKETGGTFVKTPTNTELENLYFQCRGRTAGARTLLRRAATFRVGQTRSYARRVAKGQRKATFFVSYGAGRYRLRLTQPGGRVYTKTTGRRVRFVRARTFSFVEVRQPKAGAWRLRITRQRTGARTDRATTTITVQRRAGGKVKRRR